LECAAVDSNLGLKFLPETETVGVMFQDREIHKKGEVPDEKELQTLIAYLHPGNYHQR
jgi:hypothetical protein